VVGLHVVSHASWMVLAIISEKIVGLSHSV
jgi:hypothetical protein